MHRTIDAHCTTELTMHFTTEQIKRFWDRVDTSGECWIWTAGYFACGYGRLWHEGRDIYAHRVAYLLTHGSIPDKAEICHHCDNPACVRPEHLYAGTHSDNMRDRRDRNRVRVLRGSDNGNSRLTWDQVRTIRQRYAEGGTSCKRLGAEYNVDQALIHRIVRGRTWKE